MQPPPLHRARLTRDYWLSRARRSISLETTYCAQFLTNRSAVGIRSLLLGSQSVHFDYVAPGRHVTSDRQVIRIDSIPHGSSIKLDNEQAFSDDPAVWVLHWIEQIIWVDGVVERFNPVRFSTPHAMRRALVLQSWDATAHQLRRAGETELLAKLERDHVPLRGIVSRTLDLVSIARGGEIDIPSPVDMRWPV